MERHKLKGATISTDCLWPASSTQAPPVNLWEAFGAIIHAYKISVEWETTDLEPNPYKGREPQFAGSVKVQSDNKAITLPVGAIAASYIGSVQNQIQETK